MADTLETATRMWVNVFTSGPYSSFGMLNAVMKELNLSYEDVLTKPTSLKNFKRKSVNEENLYHNPFLATWSLNSGRCTSFALKVAHCLALENPGMFKFKYFDIGKHRVAHCEETGVLIDSGSDIGAAKLVQSSEGSQLPGLRGLWLLSNSEICYERNAGSGTKKARPITASQAMGKCLEEVAKEPVLLCLFRGQEPGDFRGMIKWNFKDRCVESTPNIKNKGKKIYMSFSEEGTEETRGACIKGFSQFLEVFGDSDQWEVDGISEFHENLWEAAIRLWGHPVMSLSENLEQDT